MDWKMLDLQEVTQYDRSRGFYRAKKAYFSVNGTEHTLIISMKDFDADKTNELVQKEVDKIISVLGKTKK